MERGARSPGLGWGRSILLAVAFAAVAIVPVVVASVTDRPSPTDGVPGRDVGPRNPPFGDDGVRTTLADAERKMPFDIYRPKHDLASDQSITDVWILLPDEGDAQTVIWYDSQLQMYFVPVAPNDPDPLEANDMPEDAVWSFETINGLPALVVEGGIQGPHQPGRVEFVVGDLRVSLFGWPGSLTTDQLRSIAATIDIPVDQDVN